MSAGAITSRIPLVVWWLASLVLVAMLMVVSHAYAERETDERVEYETALEWQSTTYVVTGEFESLVDVQETLPFSWSATANYRISVPAAAEVQPGESILVERYVGRTGKKPPTSAQQDPNVQLRVTDDARHRVEQSGATLRSAEVETRVEEAQLDAASDRRSSARIGMLAISAVVFAGLGLWTFLRPGRARRFAGSRIPAEVTVADGPYSEERWQCRNRILPALEKDAKSPELPIGLGIILVLAVIPAFAAPRSEVSLLVIAGVALSSLALWIRERQTAGVRNSWSRLGLESGMGAAPDTAGRLKSRKGAILLRLSAVLGLGFGLLLLLFGLAGLAMFSEPDGSDPAVGMLTGGAVIVVTAGFCFAAGVAQQRDGTAERRGAQLR